MASCWSLFGTPRITWRSWGSATPPGGRCWHSPPRRIASSGCTETASRGSVPTVTTMKEMTGFIRTTSSIHRAGPISSRLSATPPGRSSGVSARSFLGSQRRGSGSLSDSTSPTSFHWDCPERATCSSSTTGGDPDTRGAAKAWTLIPIAVCLFSGCATRTVYVPDGTPVRLRETVRDAKVWVLDSGGKPVPGRMALPEGWYALPPEPEEE